MIMHFFNIMNVSKLFAKLIALTHITLLCVAASQAVAAEISVSVDRNPVSMDESFKIFFTATETPDGDPDFTPLEQDFTIVNQSQSTSSSWVNGTYNKSVKWVVDVTAKKDGRLFIPAIQFGDDTSEPLPITVSKSPANDTAAQNNEELFLDVKAAPEQPYVQSQVLFTIRLYRRVDVAQAELTEPELADAVVEKLGEDSNYNTVVNGVSYLVTERKYAIFPQKSGEIKIKPLTLTAEVIVSGRPDFRDFFSSRMTKTKRVLSQEVVLNVKPAPPEFKGKNWLAAEKLELSQDWSGDIQQMKVSEPLTRTLTLKGTGTTVGQLPELNTVITSDKIKAYPDQPALNEQKQTNGIAATRQEKIALIPAAAGKQTLPALEIPWFNTLTRKIEIATLPEVTINVIGASVNQPEASASALPSTKPSPPFVTPKSTTQFPLTTQSGGQNVWPWLALALALGWLVTLVYFLRKRPKIQESDQQTEQKIRTEISLKECIKILKKACAEDDALATKNALLTWGKHKFNADNLSAVAGHCDARLRDEIMQLNQTLYGKGNSYHWTGKKLLQAFTENAAKSKIATQEDDALEPLYRL